MRRSRFLQLALLAALLHLPLDGAKEGNFSWRRYKDPQAAGFAKAALRQIEEHYSRSGLASLFVVHQGRVLLALGDYQRRFQCHSIRKTLMNAVMGICHDEKKIDLNKTLADLKIDDIGGLTETEKQATVKNLLQARSGVYHPAVYETASMTKAKPQRGTHGSGSFWHYNNWDFNALSTIVNRETGDDFLRLFTERIAGPLGMEDYREIDGNYFLDPAVSRHPGYGFKLSARDLARFGLLYLQKGVWNGSRVLSERWIADSTRSYSNTHTARGGYGYLWWIPAIGGAGPAFAACGVGTQVLLVLPGLDLVIVQRVNTFRGQKHPFDPSLYEKIAAAVKTANINTTAECIPLTGHPESAATAIMDRDKFIGSYGAADGIYRIRAHGDGLVVVYPKGMQARLLPMENKDTFLVEDIFEVIRLKKAASGKNGELLVLGHTK